ncbi:hypothetical protein QOZ80_2AG0103010 [Eleusine coracana subsp. coracana]|uniref:Knottin scorpion toxin-like domain-containing protein n=1 Tax=Eleusine coracana subsp. coracana TaxID=191504 RepID=A0AAV9FWL0_ELECO|nr:hypothetical protein QOZ80_UnG0727120 [Eleusine coracana subsp. coracana]KAK3156113.1 hypothetical protein QOZ80_2AG0103010 [Eleusine coracana subsp. coracana]
MACKATSLVASALLILALLSMSIDTGVEAWCLSYPFEDIKDACRHGGLKNCVKKCKGKGFRDGAQCNNLGDCLCLKCVDQGKPPAAHSVAATNVEA